MKKMTRKRALELLTMTLGEAVTVKKLAEYPTLFIGERIITQGSVEVKNRISVLIRENGLQFEE